MDSSSWWIRSFTGKVCIKAHVASARGADPASISLKKQDRKMKNRKWRRLVREVGLVLRGVCVLEVGIQEIQELDEVSLV